MAVGKIQIWQGVDSLPAVSAGGDSIRAFAESIARSQGASVMGTLLGYESSDLGQIPQGEGLLDALELRLRELDPVAEFIPEDALELEEWPEDRIIEGSIDAEPRAGYAKVFSVSF